MYRHFHLVMLASCFIISIDDDILLMALLLFLVWWCSDEVWWFSWRYWFYLFIWAMFRYLLFPSYLFHCCNISFIIGIITPVVVVIIAVFVVLSFSNIPSPFCHCRWWWMMCNFWWCTNEDDDVEHDDGFIFNLLFWYW